MDENVQAVNQMGAGLYAGAGQQMSAVEYERQRDAQRNAAQAAWHYKMPVDEVALRRWAMELAVGLYCPPGAANDRIRLASAKLFADFALTGVVPSDEGKAT